MFFVDKEYHWMNDNPKKNSLCPICFVEYTVGQKRPAVFLWKKTYGGKFFLIHRKRKIWLWRYMLPDYWTIGEVYERLIEDICGDNEARVIECLIEVYTSWIDGAISNYNTDFYYQSLDYIYECYKEGRVLE